MDDKEPVVSVNNPESVPLENQEQPIDAVPITTSPKKSKKQLFIIAFIVLSSSLIGAGITFLLVKNDASQPETNTQTTAPTNNEANPNETDSQLAKFLEPQSGEVWHDAAIKISNQGWMKQESGEGAPTVNYFEVGERGENKIIITLVEALGASIHFFEQEPDGKVRLIRDLSSTIEPAKEIYAEQFTEVVEIDSETHYDTFSVPESGLTLDSGYMLNSPEQLYVDINYDGGEGTSVIDELQTTIGKVQRYETTYEEPGLKKTWFRYNMDFGYSINLFYQPISRDGETISWKSGESRVDSDYSSIVRGCGVGTGTSHGFRLVDSDLVSIGTTADGKELFELVSLDYKLLTKVVEEFNEFNKYDESFTPVNKQAMMDRHGLIFYKDAIGNWLVYTRDDLSPEAGCAKPVVYLYPETTTEVNVKVGADVKISDPQYPQNGWTVQADPNGLLKLDGSTYSSLFWEGPGWGQYPSITTGTIVPTDKAIQTIQSQLKTLGLNQTEVDDFIEYWQDKLPNKPYTRLTWLTTEELNRLAPLFITPKPDTILRVFLDYSGIDEPYDLEVQVLVATDRRGFTVVEWGGLSPFKLY